MRYYVLAALPALLFAVTVQAADFTEKKLVPSDAAESDSFGSGVTISGTTVMVMVGAPFKNNFLGMVYPFDATTGTQTVEFDANGAPKKGLLGWGESIFSSIAGDGTIWDQFGKSVAISGATAIIGAMGKDNKKGAAYLFDITTGKQTAKLSASDAAKGDFFGISAALQGTTAVVGANGFNLDGGGAAYLFDTTTGKQTAKLTPSDAERGNYFGSAVAISDTTIIVGARGSNDNGSQSGAA